METAAATAPNQSGQMPTPDRILGTVTAFIQTRALRTAIELDLFTAIADGATTAEQLARKCNTSQRGIRILADYLTVFGFLVKTDGVYSLAPDSAAFLVKYSPAYLGSVVFFLVSDHVVGEFANLTQVVREGTCSDHGAGLEPEHPMWVDFAKSMAPMMMMPANLLAGHVLAGSQTPMKVLDIAAGHGMFGITIAQRNPNAHIVGVDWKNVLEYAKENAVKFGVSDRYETLPGSAFDVEFGSGYDLILLPNFLHHFEPPRNVQLLKKVRQALAPGGRVATLEFVPNDDRVSPHFPAAFSMMMLGGTPSGDAYTFAELERMFADAGFGMTSRVDLTPTASTLLISTV